MPAGTSAPTSAMGVLSSTSDGLSAEYVPPSAPGGTPGGDTPGEIDYSPSGAELFGSDILDETTRLANEEEFVLTGEKIANNLSVKTPGCIDTAQMEVQDSTSGFVNAPFGWSDPAEMPNWVTDHVYAPNGDAIAIAKHTMNSTYVDPDQDEMIYLEGLALYAHLPEGNLTDPVLQSGEWNPAEPEYGSQTYPSPWAYNQHEQAALDNKYGFNSVDYPADVYNGTLLRLEEDIGKITEALQVGFQARQNITRVSPQINIFDNYEKIETQEVAEDTAIAEAASAPETTTVTIGRTY